MQLSLLAALLLSACVFVPGANAQTQSPSPPQAQSPSASPQPGQSANIPDEKLSAAAAALQRVVGIKQDYEQRLAAANASDKQHLLDEANLALTKAVTDQGLSVEEYTAIMVVAQNDPQVREKILQRLPQAQPHNPSSQ
jgi:hypothetical protein